MDLSRLTDPKFILAQTRYENYRIAVDKSYKIAEATTSWDEFKFVCNSEKGEPLYSRLDSTPTSRVEEIVRNARLLVPAIYEDLEKAIQLLEEAHGSKTTTSTLSKPS